MIDKKLIRSEIRKVYRLYDLKDNLIMLYGADLEGVKKEKVYRVIIRTLVELGSPDSLYDSLQGVGMEVENIEDVKVIRVCSMSRVEKYLNYIITCEATKYNLFHANDLYSFQKFFLYLQKELYEVNDYLQFRKIGGYKGAVNKGMAVVLIDTILQGFKLVVEQKGWPLSKNYITEFASEDDKLNLKLFLRFLQLHKDISEPEANEDPFGSGKNISFPKALLYLGLKDNRTLKKLLDEIGLKYIETVNKNYVTEANLNKVYLYLQQRGS
jgi:hypothetical protein